VEGVNKKIEGEVKMNRRKLRQPGFTTTANSCSLGITLWLATIMFFVGVLVTNYLDILKLSKVDLESQISNLAAMERRLERVEVTYQTEFEKKVAWAYTYMLQYNPSLSIEVARTAVAQSYIYKNIDLQLICALVTHESAMTWNPKVRSYTGAVGLMQILPSTGKYLAEISNLDISWTSAEEVLTNPVNNMRLGCFYLSMLIDTYGLQAGLACYNGPHKLGQQFKMLLASGSEKAHEVLTPETQGFITLVLRRYNKLLKLTTS